MEYKSVKARRFKALRERLRLASNAERWLGPAGGGVRIKHFPVQSDELRPTTSLQTLQTHDAEGFKYSLTKFVFTYEDSKSPHCPQNTL